MESVSQLFLATDDYVPKPLRELLCEADGCRQSGFLIGGTACARRALELLLSVARAQGVTFEERLQVLCERHGVPKALASILAQCANAASQDGTTFSAELLELFVVTMKAVVYELYVLGPERAERLQYVSSLVQAVERKTAGDPAMTSLAAGDVAEVHEVLR